MKPPGGLVTVIIPTLARSSRANTLRRAVASARQSCRTSPLVLIVVNGQHFDKELLEELRFIPEVEIVHILPGSLPMALQTGRRAVRSDFFAFLDDDDELLPGGLELLMHSLLAHPERDFAIGNGYRHARGGDALCVGDMNAVRSDPLRALLVQNWLASCAGLYRTSRIEEPCFEGIAPWTEWTWMAFTLMALRKRVFVIDTPIYRIHDTEDSASKSIQHRMGYTNLFDSILKYEWPNDVRSCLESRRAAAWHDLSTAESEAGELWNAWKCHLRSVVFKGGIRYVLYTRHLVRATLGRLFRQRARPAA